MGFWGFIFYLVYYPGSSSLDGIMQSKYSVAVLVVVDVEHSHELFRLRGIFIDFLLQKTIKVFIVNFDFERVFGHLLIIDPDLFKGRQAY